MKRLTIYGAGRFGKYILREIKDYYQVDVLIDNYIERGFDDELGIPIVTLDMFKNEWKKTAEAVIIAALDSGVAQNMVLSLIPWYEGKIYIADVNCFTAQLPILDDHDNFKPYIRSYEEVKPTLSYVEHDVTSFCNLKCKNCGHRSDLVKTINQTDKDEFEESLLGLSEMFDNINVFRLMGGEPLVVKDLDWYIGMLRHVFPNTDIHVVTNGLLIDSVSERVLCSLRDNSVCLDISQYIPTREKIDDITTVLFKHDIRFRIGKPIKKFIKRRDDNQIPVYDEKIHTLWRNCGNRRCHTMKGRKLMACGVVERMNGLKGFDSGLNECTIDLTRRNTISGWDALLRLETPFYLCGYCTDEREYVDWESNRL